MACRFKFILALVIVPVIASGCITLRIEKVNVGNAVPVEQLLENQSTLAEALTACGAPAEIVDLEGRIVFVYEKEFYKGAELGVEIPLSLQTSGAGVNFSGYGSLWKYDRLVLFFSPNWVLTGKVYVQGSQEPFLKTLLHDKGPGK